MTSWCGVYGFDCLCPSAADSNPEVAGFVYNGPGRGMQVMDQLTIQTQRVFTAECGPTTFALHAHARPKHSPSNAYSVTLLRYLLQYLSQIFLLSAFIYHAELQADCFSLEDLREESEH